MIISFLLSIIIFLITPSIKYLKKKQSLKKIFFDDIGDIITGLALNIIFLLIVKLIATDITLKSYMAISFINSFALVFIRPFSTIKKIPVNKILRRIGFIMLFMCLLENIGFNYKSFSNKLANVQSNGIVLSENIQTKNITIVDDSYKLGNKSEIEISNIDQKVINLYLNMTGNKIIKATFYIQDEHYKNNYFNVKTIEFFPEVESSLRIPITSNGNANKIKIVFEGNYSNNLINSIIINKTTPLNFNVFRYLLFTGIICGLFMVFRKKFYLMTFEFQKRPNIQKVLLSTMAFCLLVFIIIAMFNKELFFINYKNISDVTNESFYLQQFDAFVKHKYSLDVAVDPRLLELSNPYDPSQRAGINYLWDRVFYNGKYYIYFGIAPIILLYFPIYFLSGMVYIPSLLFVDVFFLIIAVFMSILAILEMAKVFMKTVNKFALIICIITMLFSSGYLISAFSENAMYNSPLISGVSFMFIMYYTIFKAYNNKDNFKMKISCISIAATSLILMIMSRPNYLLLVIPLVPFIFKMLLNKDNKFISNLKPFIPGIIILIIGMGWTFYYNYARFDSIFEFGSNYQLTVSDIRANKISLTNLIPSIIYYFFQMPVFDGSFPYIVPSYFVAIEKTNYIYIYYNIGLFSIPLFLTLFAIPFFKKKENSLQKSFLTLGLITLFIMSFVNYSLAGVHHRYMLDLFPLASLLSIMVIFILFEKINPHKMAIYVSIIGLTTIFVMINYHFFKQYGAFYYHYPDFYFNVQEFFEFLK